ncbi:MAG: arsenite methyltransferase [Alphaproteobacteria bacterium]
MSARSDIRREVRDFYARAASSRCCAGEAPQKGVVARVAGYSTEELGPLPDDAVENSFGCGNPVAFAGLEGSETVVDLGAGAGIDLLLAARKVGPEGRVIGVDMTDEMISRARKNIAEAGLGNVEVRKGFIEDLPVETGSVDWVISNCVINLSPDKPKVFAEIARVLRPGGKISISDIVVEDLPECVRRDTALYASCVGGAISEPDYVSGLAEAGLVDVEVIDRLVYGATEIEALMRSEVSDRKGRSGAPRFGGSAGELAGKIWSARFTARKATG